MDSGAPKRPMPWDPLGQPDEIPAKRMCLTLPLIPSVPERMEIEDEIPMKRRRLDSMGTTLTGSSAALEVYPSPCGDVAAQGPSGDASGKTTEGLPQSSELQGQPEDFSLAGPSSEGDGRPQVPKDEPMFTMSQVQQMVDNIWKQREVWLRENYDRVLTTKLAEQYESFVAFTNNQIEQKLRNTTPSYMS
ncbi:hypothetical protein HPB50_024513 [Hyalomma asiaticum]|uniref:Uncharacterized protein n=1 Tax=Hyalomma asiaticum TaxID=266040 RepID=A0ACB7TQB8_HYAAI|nr:hypothetical protein HPB50_024513 [Hyalomma asiaticum]